MSYSARPGSRISEVFGQNYPFSIIWSAFLGISHVQNGGAVSINTSSDFTVSKSTFTNCTSVGNGGAIAVDSFSRTFFDKSCFYRCFAYDGQGIYSMQTSGADSNVEYLSFILSSPDFEGRGHDLRVHSPSVSAKNLNFSFNTVTAHTTLGINWANTITSSFVSHTHNRLGNIVHLDNSIRGDFTLSNYVNNSYHPKVTIRIPLVWEVTYTGHFYFTDSVFIDNYFSGFGNVSNIFVLDSLCYNNNFTSNNVLSYPSTKDIGQFPTKSCHPYDGRTDVFSMSFFDPHISGMISLTILHILLN